MADLELVTCNSCGGTYAPRQADGTEYYHACPTRRIVGHEAAPTKDDPEATRPIFAAVVNPRNENVKDVDKDGKAILVAEGAGVTPVTDPILIAAFTTSQQEA